MSLPYLSSRATLRRYRIVRGYIPFVPIAERLPPAGPILEFMSTPSATLTVWAAAWLSGRGAPDDLLDALHAWAPRQQVIAGDPVAADHTGIAGPDRHLDGLTDLLRTLRQAGQRSGVEFRLLLPVPGDVRGVPAGTAFATEALAVGEGVVIGVPGGDGIGLVPLWSADESLVWSVHTVPVPTDAGSEISLGEAEYMMREAVREAAEELARLEGLAGVGPGENPRELIEAELATYTKHQYPTSIPLRARRVLDTADHVAAILTVAQRTPTHTPTAASSERTHETLFRPLWNAIRHARLAAIKAAARGSE